MRVIIRTLSISTMLLLIVAVSACGTTPNPRLGEIERQVVGGDPDRGHAVLIQYGCGSCHVIPGIAGANAYVGPPLNHYDQRTYIAGAMLNNTENLITWIINPQAIEPGTAMPNLNVSEEDARHMAAYLYTLTR